MKKTLLEKMADQSGMDEDEKVKRQEQEINGQGESPEVSSSSPQTLEQSAETTVPVDPTLVIDFFQQNPDPNDEAYHQFAEQQNWDVHEAESVAYRLATRFVNFLKGGRMNTTDGFDLNAVDPNQLDMGVKVEMEHTTDPNTSKKIALDHLAEIPDYYTRLAQMEQDAQQTESAAAAPNPEGNGEDEAEEAQENGTPSGDTAPSALFKQSAYQRGVAEELKKHAKCMGAYTVEHRSSTKKKKKPLAKYR